MASFVPLPHTAQAEMRFTWDSQDVEMVWCYDYESTDFEACANTASILLHNMWNTIKGVFTNDITYRELYVTDQATQDGPVALTTEGIPGGDVGLGVPNNVAFCITLVTAKRGRSFRGRKYFPGIAAHNYSANLLSSGVASTILDAVTGMIEAAAGAGFPLVVPSRRHNGAPRTVGVTTVVTDAKYQDLIADSQRRRLPGRGR